MGLYSCQTEKTGQINRKSDCIIGNVGRAEVPYSMVETQSNENVQMSGAECRRANNTLFPTSNAVEKLVQSVLT